MRSNGLTARAYTPIADLDPVLADALLDDLRRQGVAAYTKPVESTSAAFDRPEFRHEVHDRLFVDAAASTQVRDLLKLEHPGLLDDANEDLAWEQIVAGFDAPFDAEVAPWPVDEDLDKGESAAEPGLFQRPPDAAQDQAQQWADGGALPFTDRRRWSDRLNRREREEPVLPEPLTPPGQFDTADFLESTSQGRPSPPAEDEDEDRFIPEPPPPLPKLAPIKLLSWLGVLGGPLLLLAAVFSTYHPQPWVVFVAVVGFIGGFITLVATMADRDEWDPDNGAVV